MLSINALSGNDNDNSMKLKSMVKDKVMLILLDSRSSHSFIGSNFAGLAKLETIPIPAIGYQGTLILTLNPNNSCNII
jgi:hypothetical protein